MKIKSKSEFSLTMPSFLWLVLFFLVPTLLIFTIAFKPSDIYGGIGEGWTLDTFQDIFSISLLKTIYRTLWLSILTTFFCLCLALPFGYYITGVSPKRKQLLLLLIILPFWSSFIVRIFAWKTLLHPEGFLKQILVFFNLVDVDTVLLYNAAAVVIVMVYSYLPFAILPIYASSVRFDLHLFEAALDLGMSRLQIFFKVYLPCIQKGIFTALVMVFIPAIGAYVIPEIVGGPQNEMIGNKIVQRTFTDRDLPQASALSALLSLAVLIPLGVTALIRSGRPRAVKGGH